MRDVIVACAIAHSAIALSTGARAEDDFMKACLVTGTPKMCECMSAQVPADKRAAAIDGMRRSNAMTAPGGDPTDPSTLSPEQMKGMDIVVSAQAACT